MARSLQQSLSAVLVVSALLVVSAMDSRAQNRGTIQGTVTDAGTGEALPGANVGIVGSLVGTTTDLDGRYSFEVVPSGTYTVRVSFVGYTTTSREVTVSTGGTATADFSLTETVAQFGEELVVLGSRSSRTAVETPVPVDVIPAQALESVGAPELNQALSYLAPSYNASHQTIADGTDHVNPASIRGLGPDQV
ncbi:MAG: carboxypeptidase-like regulatory domain-containing protein, partial [Rhodothermales bacterium]|nr:carboxypeptidase-like regulatory domain-containing protein [Rhodothermales bacterium]